MHDEKHQKNLGSAGDAEPRFFQGWRTLAEALEAAGHLRVLVFDVL